jgi:hypothetical protein
VVIVIEICCVKYPGVTTVYICGPWAKKIKLKAFFLSSCSWAISGRTYFWVMVIVAVLGLGPSTGYRYYTLIYAVRSTAVCKNRATA